MKDSLRKWFARSGAPQEPTISEDEPVQIKTFVTRLEAEMAKNLLDSYDIPSYISAADFGGISNHLLAGSGGARLMVRRDHAEKAIALLENHTAR